MIHKFRGVINMCKQIYEYIEISEFLLEHGFIDKIVERKEMKDTLYQIIKFHKGGNQKWEK